MRDGRRDGGREGRREGGRGKGGRELIKGGEGGRWNGEWARESYQLLYLDALAWKVYNCGSGCDPPLIVCIHLRCQKYSEKAIIG